MIDLIVRGGVASLPDGREERRDVAVEGGRIARLEPEISEPARAEVDARGLRVLPAAIDPHVHGNEPGREAWEGFATLSAALAAGGAATLVDMPLNSVPTRDARALREKRAAAERAARVDVALWGALLPGNLAELPGLAEEGAVGFKAFLSDSGLPEFPRCDDDALLEGMRAAARLGLPVAVHAESEELTRGRTLRLRAAGRRDPLATAEARPALAEVEAVRRALLYAEDAGCAVHLVHLSSARAVAEVRAATARGVDASCEACAHHLFLTERDLEELGAVAKCAPPLRPEAERSALVEAVARGEVAWVASDHSPCPPELKSAPDAFDAWGGIAGAQSTLAVLTTLAARGALAWRDVPRLAAGAAAERLRLPGKGRLEPGADADLVLIAPDERWTLRREDLRDRHRLSPYAGRSFVGRARLVLSRGEIVARGGEVLAPPGRGRVLRPLPRPAPPPPDPRQEAP